MFIRNYEIEQQALFASYFMQSNATLNYIRALANFTKEAVLNPKKIRVYLFR